MHWIIIEKKIEDELWDDLSQVLNNVRAYFQMTILLESVDNEMQVLLVNVWCDDISMTLSGKTLQGSVLSRLEEDCWIYKASVF